jgi:hypothetical protein
MSLLALFDLSLLGRASQPALECESPDGARESFTFGNSRRAATGSLIRCAAED